MPFLYRIEPDGTALERWRLANGPLVVGRDENADIRIDDACLSQEHFMIDRENGVLYLRDLTSKNGTWVDGFRVRCVELHDGARIRAGCTLFMIEPGLTTALAEAAPPRTTCNLSRDLLLSSNEGANRP